MAPHLIASAGRLLLDRLRRRLFRRFLDNARLCDVLFVALDIASFAREDMSTQRQLRARLYAAVKTMRNGAACPVTYGVLDRGDGVLILMPDTVDVVRLLETAIPAVATEIGTTMRMRCVIHKGRAYRDRWGWVGEDINRVFRLIDSPILRRRLKEAKTPLVVALSNTVYTEALDRLDQDQQKLENVFKPWEDRPLEHPFRVKETNEKAWVAAVRGEVR